MKMMPNVLFAFIKPDVSLVVNIKEAVDGQVAESYKYVTVWL